MAKNASNVRIFGSEDDAVWFQPKGAPKLTEITEEMQNGQFPAPAVEVGYIEEGGIPMSLSTDATSIKAHQGGAKVRVKNTSTERTVQLAMLESNPLTWKIVQGVGDKDRRLLSSGVAEMHVKGSMPTVEGTLYVYAKDDAIEDENDVWYIWEIPLAQVSEREDSTIGVEDVYSFGATMEIIGDLYVYTNDPAILEGLAA